MLLSMATQSPTVASASTACHSPISSRTHELTLHSFDGCHERLLLDGEGSCARAELLERHGQSSLPHCFIDGVSVGGLYSGPSGGLLELKAQRKLVPMLEKAGALIK